MAFEPAPTQTIVADATPFDSGPLVSQQDFDQIDTLPAPCAEKLRLLRRRAADLFALVPSHENVSEISIEKIKMERELQRLVARESEGGFSLPPSDQRCLPVQRRLDKLSAELARVTALKASRTASWQVAAGVLRAVETWLRDGRPHGTALEIFDGPETKLAKGEDIVAAIGRLRQRGRELQAKLQRVRAAKLPSADAKKRMREQVQHWATRAGATVAALVGRTDGKIEFRRELLRVQVHNVPAPGAVGFAEAVDPVALLSWLFKDAMIKRLDAEIDNEADDAASLAPEARQKAEADALSGVLVNDRDLAALVWMGQSQGLPVEHSDCAPQAILGCRLVTTPRALPPPESSLEHAFGVTGR